MSMQVSEQFFDPIASNQITIVSDGDYWLLQIRTRPRGWIVKVLVQQLTGASVPFAVEVLNSNLGLTAGEQAPSALPTGWQNRRIMKTLQAGPGVQAQAFVPFGNPFRNTDGPDPVKSGLNASGLVAPNSKTSYTNAQEYMYVLIMPNAGDGANSTWMAAVTSITEVGD